MKHNTSQKGFTLIELIAVMVILGILAAVLIPRLSSVQESAYEVNAKQMYTALEAHLNMQSMQAAIQGAHGLKQFPNVTLFENLGIDIKNEKEVIKNYIKVQETFNKKDSVQFLKTLKLIQQTFYVPHRPRRLY